MSVRHAQKLAYHSGWNRRAELAGSKLFQKLRPLYMEEPGRNWYHALWRVMQAYHNLLGTFDLSPDSILLMQFRISLCVWRMNIIL